MAIQRRDTTFVTRMLDDDVDLMNVPSQFIRRIQLLAPDGNVIITLYKDDVSDFTNAYEVIENGFLENDTISEARLELDHVNIERTLNSTVSEILHTFRK